ncbi:2-oxo acid dehydrogenase subunit E2 [Streptosporangium amethystogenes subsp. fukuiense]|uniref:Dihydrolipoamide acetyltransferase component of pyruvate dehydrogenase complex n=1 Tax=Streptosporangium amethystogenes subsp. fukuiense TaxID=698418 RepID=A0ABW2SQQ3_9ACTN
MTEVRVPKLNNNDASYLLVEWEAKDGQAVRAGEPLAVLETSKAAEELTAERDGTLRHLLQVGAECSPGQVIARLLSAGEDPAADPAPSPAETGAGQEELVITAPARRAMAEYGISMDQVRALGRKVVRRADLVPPHTPHGGTGGAVSVTLPPIEPMRGTVPLTPPDLDDSHLIEPSRAQRRTAEVVERSHREIPASFTVMRVDVTDALPFARAETKRLRALIGLPELLVQATGRLLDRFPLFFATPVDGRRARRATTAEVGVTVDVGGGMYVPVVRDAGRRPLDEIARDLAGFRKTALGGTFRERDLVGGNIMLTLHTDTSVITAIPIVFPGQICALSLGAPRPEVVETREGAFVTRKVISLGLAYDHRFVNGRDAAEFLGALRSALEKPGNGDV